MPKLTRAEYLIKFRQRQKHLNPLGLSHDTFYDEETKAKMRDKRQFYDNRVRFQKGLPQMPYDRFSSSRRPDAHFAFTVQLRNSTGAGFTHIASEYMELFKKPEAEWYQSGNLVYLTPTDENMQLMSDLLVRNIKNGRHGIITIRF